MTQSNQLTLRGFNARLHQSIRALARRERISLNKAALRLMEKGAGLVAPTTDDRIGHSLDHLMGTWSKAEGDEVLESIQSCEQVDKELWE